MRLMWFHLMPYTELPAGFRGVFKFIHEVVIHMMRAAGIEQR